MKPTMRYGLTGIIAAVIAGAIWTGIWFANAADQPVAKADAAETAVPVTTAIIKSGQVSQIVTAYGNVTAQPGAAVVLSAWVECQIKHLHVSSGQMVDTGANVIEIQPSPDAKLALIDARNGLEGAKKDAAALHQRLDLKLATNADAQTADRAVQAAQLKFDDLTRRGAGDESKTIQAAEGAIVAKVDVQEGQLVPAGAPLVELVPRGQIEMRLGVEPGDAILLRPGQAVQLFPSTADDDEPVDGTIRLVTHRVNPDTRLVDVFTTPDDTDQLLLDGFVRGELTLKTISGLIVPHNALLPGDQGFSIFTVVNGHATRHPVKVAVQNDNEAVITGNGLHEGDVVVTAGNLELDDNAAVAATTAAAAPVDAEGDK